jgi:hypothetical protein
MMDNHDSVQMGSSTAVMSLSYQAAQVATHGGTATSVYSSAMVAAHESSMEGCTGSALVATGHSKVTAVQNAAVVGGAGGLASFPGQVSQGAGILGAEGTAQTSKVTFMGTLPGETGANLTLQNIPGAVLSLDLNSTYHLKTVVVGKGATGSVGVMVSQEGIVVLDADISSIYSNLTDGGLALNDPSNVLPSATSVTIGMTGSCYNVAVLGYTGLETRWVATTEFTKVSF